MLKKFFFIIAIISFSFQIYKYFTKGFPTYIYTSDKSIGYKFGYFVGYDLYLITGIILFIIAINIKSRKVV